MSNPVKQNETEVIRKPARRQLDPSLVSASNKPEQTGQTFNIWYSKWTGGENNGRRSIGHSLHRCNIKKDSGYTKADKNWSSDHINKSKFICLYFARGYCCNGKQCDYLHRLPTEFDIFPATVDCFGRERFYDYRDDMSGVGSFARVNKTLYVNGFATMNGNIEMKISKAFGEFGDLSSINVIPAKRIAFVSYKLESQAQFAKEAMYCQSLDYDDKKEILNIRWANEDSNFATKKRKIENDEEITMEMARKLLEHFKTENQNKKKDLHVEKNTAKNSERDFDKNKELKVNLDYDGLTQLSQLRRMKRNNKQQIIQSGLVTGYSSDDD